MIYGVIFLIGAIVVLMAATALGIYTFSFSDDKKRKTSMVMMLVGAALCISSEFLLDNSGETDNVLVSMKQGLLNTQRPCHVVVIDSSVYRFLVSNDTIYLTKEPSRTRISSVIKKKI